MTPAEGTKIEGEGRSSRQGGWSSNAGPQKSGQQEFVMVPTRSAGLQEATSGSQGQQAQNRSRRSGANKAEGSSQAKQNSLPPGMAQASDSLYRILSA